MVQAYMDSDGLYRRYGTDKTTPSVAGEYRTNTGRRMIEIKLDLTTVGATNGGTIIDDNVFFPKNVRIEQIDVVTVTAAVGASGVLNLGLVATDRSTEIDFNGLVAAIPTTSMDAAGETTILNVGSTYAGALLGTTTASVGYLCADYDTTAFSAGVVIFRIWYNVP